MGEADEMAVVAPAKRLFELDRRQLRFCRHYIEHVPTGDHYYLVRSNIADPRFAPTRAFYRDEAGEVTYVERSVPWSALIDAGE